MLNVKCRAYTLHFHFVKNVDCRKTNRGANLSSLSVDFSMLTHIAYIIRHPVKLTALQRSVFSYKELETKFVNYETIHKTMQWLTG